MKMTMNQLREYLSNLVSHITFEYNGTNCGIDPISQNEFDIWYGESANTVNNLDLVFTIPIFDGKAFTDIFDEIESFDL